jgi:hypothetical protein
MVGLAAEFAAGVQRCQDDFEGGFVGETRMSIDRDPATIVSHGDPVAGAELDLDAGGMASNRLVHSVVEDFGGEVVEPALVGAADIHSGATADRLQPFEDFDVLCRIAVDSFRVRRIEQIGHGANIERVSLGASRIRCILSP